MLGAGGLNAHQAAMAVAFAGDEPGRANSLLRQRYISQKKTRLVAYDCCCLCCTKRYVCKVTVCWNILNLITSFFFWAVWGVGFVFGLSGYMLIPLALFGIIVTNWNPLYYSSSIRSKYEEMIQHDDQRRLCGICGCCDCCFKCCTVYCKSWRKKLNCTPAVCGKKMYHFIGFLCACGIAFNAFAFPIIFNVNGTGQIENVVTLLGLVTVTFILPFYFVPSVGYLFYQSPISFALFHIISTMLCFFIPLFAWIKLQKNVLTNTAIISVFKCDFFYEYFPEKDCYRAYGYESPDDVVSDDDTDGSWEKLDGDERDELIFELFLVSMLFVTIFLSFSGFSCAYYRFKKALVLSQRKVYNVILQLQSTDDNKMYNMTLYRLTIIRFGTLVFAFLDFISDFAFVTLNTDWANSYIRYFAILLFCLQIFVQLLSLIGALKTLSKKFESGKSIAYIDILKEKIHICKCCYCIDAIISFFISVVYGVFMIILSVILGLTKLLAIKQIQEWWFSWMIVDYAKHLEKAKEDKDYDNDKQEIRSVPSLKEMVSSKSNVSENNDNDNDDEKGDSTENGTTKVNATTAQTNEIAIDGDVGTGDDDGTNENQDKANTTSSNGGAGDGNRTTTSATSNKNGTDDSGADSGLCALFCLFFNCCCVKNIDMI